MPDAPDPPAVVPIPLPVAEAATAYMHARTIAFWGDHPVHSGGEPKLYGSGVLLRIADRRFIVTAEHVCEMFLAKGCSVFIGGVAEKLIPLDKASIQYSKKADLALIPLSESMCAAFSSNKQFVRLCELDKHDPTDEAGGWYCAFGYPSDAADTIHSAGLHTMTAHHCWGIPFSKETKPSSDFDPAMHIAITFEHDAHPHPGGMSGCGIWRIRQPGIAEAWTLDEIRLVAVQFRAGHEHLSLVGTRTGYIAMMAKKIDPSLAPVIDLEWPARERAASERLVREAEGFRYR